MPLSDRAPEDQDQRPELALRNTKRSTPARRRRAGAGLQMPGRASLPDASLPVLGRLHRACACAAASPQRAPAPPGDLSGQCRGHLSLMQPNVWGSCRVPDVPRASCAWPHLTLPAATQDSVLSSPLRRREAGAEPDEATTQSSHLARGGAGA